MGFETNTLYRFEGFEVDPANRIFALGGKPIAIPSRVFDLLLYMARNTQRLLTKDERMKVVWGDTIVEEANLTQSVFLLRKALSAQRPTGNKLIVTVRRVSSRGKRCDRGAAASGASWRRPNPGAGWVV
jgi:DNA-binding winged helix-turn-helix (wHTH) protein